MKKIILIVLVLLISITGSFASEKTTGEKLYDLGYIEGDGSSLNEDGYLLRAEMIKVLSSIKDVEDLSKNYKSDTVFSDVSSDKWYYGYVAYAYDMGWINGYGDGSIKPEGTLTKKEALMMLMNGIDLNVTWNNVENVALENNYIDSSYISNNLIKRGELFELLYTAYGKDKFVEKEIEEVEEPIVEEKEYNEIKDILTIRANSLNTISVKLENEVDEKFEVGGFKSTDLVIGDSYFYSLDEIIIETSNMEAGKAYKLNYLDTDYTVVGNNYDKEDPTVLSAISDGKYITVTYSEKMDKKSAEDISNYDIDNLEIVEVNLIEDGKKVEIETLEQDGSVYEVESNATDFNGNEVDADYDSYKFGGQAIEGEFKLTSGIAVDAETIRLVFNNKVDEDIFSEIANYEIDDLEILEIDINDDGKTIDLTVSEMNDGVIYEIKCNGSDRLGNKIDSDYDEAKFGGIKVPDDKIKIDGPVTRVNYQKIQVKFDSKLNEMLAEDYTNYEIDDLNILKVELLDDKKTVELLVEEQTNSGIFTLEVKDIEDVFGNKIDSDYDEVKFGGLERNMDEPKINNVILANYEEGSQIIVMFDEEVDETTATDPSNYYIDNEIGYPYYVELNGNNAVLYTKKCTKGEKYNIEINNVESKDGVIGSDTVSFTGL